jgi:hypothetical protein
VEGELLALMDPNAPHLNGRWVNIARTDLEKWRMAAVRAAHEPRDAAAVKRQW